MSVALVSILDNDLYKFGMQQAVLKLYPNAHVVYRFKNRDPSMRFDRPGFEQLVASIKGFANLRLTLDEKAYLTNKCPYFEPEYIEYLDRFRFDPDAVSCQLDDTTGQVQIEISGKWSEVILFEVPVLALVSEVYFAHMDRNWTSKGQFERAYEKLQLLVGNGCVFSDFGTRRRRSFKTQDTVVRALVEGSQSGQLQGSGQFTGTSNVYLAMKYGVPPIGTVAHEWTMAVSVLERDLLHANRNALRKWLEAYPRHFKTALTDTFGTQVFFEDFDAALANGFDGLRQDSGDPKVFFDLAMNHYRKLGISPAGKALVFSDSLNTAKCIELARLIRENGEGIKALFGIGTFLTNDFDRVDQATGKRLEGQKSKAVNIVIKLYQVDGEYVVKLSDDVGKYQGDPEAVKKALATFGRQAAN
ncbi:Quinolinate phosphoribosyl transferase [Polychytrium aggregatum]|uniref:Quinolinate phosphoribosyl transferase n=1 Tax=Polychytrium aggregatum TaxID=110093 RepID=UPI0022FE77B9|nr:Quinolinate phosphoribosyl transferase [Polychytrium aggregatum]KAI9199216.1 Quinolinate phosphoribosyl transferase [Polychytrium aggregatum]